jgi:hypothetical protein
MALERRDKQLCRGRRIRNCPKKSLAVAAGKDHALMFVDYPSRAFARKVARGQAGNRHGALDWLFRRGMHAQFDALAL